MAKGNTFNVSGDDDIFGNMSDEEDDDIGFNLDGSSSSDDDDNYNAAHSNAHSSSNNAGNSAAADDLFDDDLPSDSEDSDPFVDPNDKQTDADNQQAAPAPQPSGRKPGRPSANAKPQSNQPVNNQPPAQPDYNQQNYDYNNMQSYPTGNDGMQGYGNYDPNQQYNNANMGNQGYPQQNANDFDPSQYASGYGNYDPNQYYGNANGQPQQNAGNYADNSQQYPTGNDGMQGYGNYDPNQQYNNANMGNQGYPQQPDYNQQYAQNQPDNPFASNNAQPDAGMNAWPQQDYSQQYGGSAPTAPVQNEPQQQPASTPDSSQASPFGNADSSSASNNVSTGSSYSSSWSSASITIPQPEMIFRIIKVADMLRDNLSGDEKKAVKLVFNMTAVKIDELSEMVYAVLNARKSIMTALDEFLKARNMDASKRVFYLIRLEDNDLNIISELGAQFGAEVTLDKSKKDHYATAELAELAVSTTPDSSIDLMQTVLNVYNASKDIMKNG